MNLLNSGIQVLTFSILLFSCTIVLALLVQCNVVFVNTAELSLSGDGSVSEFDSLTVECNKWCMDRNEFVNSYKDERHWWGNNNLNILSIFEVKGC